jgi:hypothetical protein
VPSESFTSSTDDANAPIPVAVDLVAGDARSRSAAKAVATVRRRQAEQRADSLDQIRAQTAAGTLVVRQMTVAEHDAALQVARRIQAHHGSGGKLARRRSEDPQ